MMNMLAYLLKKLINNEEGATVVEYAVLIALIIAGLILIIGIIGNKTQNNFDAVNTLFS